MKNKPDDRRDNVEKIQRHIDMTNKNIEAADDLINSTENQKTKRELENKNEKRREAIGSFKEEIQQEAHARDDDFK